MDALNSEFQIQAARDAETLRRAAQEAGMVIDSPPEVPNLHTMQVSLSVSICDAPLTVHPKR